MTKRKEDSLKEAVVMWVYRKDCEVSKEDIIEKTGLSIEVLDKELIRLGLISVKEEYNKAVDLYLNRFNLGITVDEVLEKECISSGTLYTELKNRGIDCKSINKTYTSRDLNEAVTLYLKRKENGLMLKEILLKTGITHSVLHGELRRRNINCTISNVLYVDKAVELYKNRKKLGISVKGILKETGISSQTLYKELKLRSVPLTYDVKSMKQVSGF
ncbi:transcriptional regulator [Bacillus cereus]|nr:transcriptional regulator [Bacillus cereus]